MKPRALWHWRCEACGTTYGGEYVGAVKSDAEQQWRWHADTCGKTIAVLLDDIEATP